MKLLITGGCGFIGSHMTLRLIEEGYDVVILDNLSNSSGLAVQAIKKITGKKPKFIISDIRDYKNLDKIFSSNKFDGVIHFAGSKAIGESFLKPHKYYENNVLGSINIISAMKKYDVKLLVFSSSASVYGDPKVIPIKESANKNPNNPYGRSKLFVELMLKDLFSIDNTWSISMLRYFNPIGAHKSGFLGENPRIPYNIMPVISDAALGKTNSVKIFGNDFSTRDGTCIRDYIHIEDLIEGHLKALKSIVTSPQISSYNLGTGKGYSVLELINTFERVSEKKIKIEFIDRRQGDVATLYTDPSKAENELEFLAKNDLTAMCEDAWRYLKKNPNARDKFT